jgi:hypothetical protein
VKKKGGYWIAGGGSTTLPCLYVVKKWSRLDWKKVYYSIMFKCCEKNGVDWSGGDWISVVGLTVSSCLYVVKKNGVD